MLWLTAIIKKSRLVKINFAMIAENYFDDSGGSEAVLHELT